MDKRLVAPPTRFRLAKSFSGVFEDLSFLSRDTDDVTGHTIIGEKEEDRDSSDSGCIDTWTMRFCRVPRSPLVKSLSDFLSRTTDGVSLDVRRLIRRGTLS